MMPPTLPPEPATGCHPSSSPLVVIRCGPSCETNDPTGSSVSEVQRTPEELKQRAAWSAAWKRYDAAVVGLVDHLLERGGEHQRRVRSFDHALEHMNSRATDVVSRGTALSAMRAARPRLTLLRGGLEG